MWRHATGSSLRRAAPPLRGRRTGRGGDSRGGERLPARARGAAALAGALLAAYAARTCLRNWDWETEEALFRAAMKARADT